MYIEYLVINDILSFPAVIPKISLKVLVWLNLCLQLTIVKLACCKRSLSIDLIFAITKIYITVHNNDMEPSRESGTIAGVGFYHP